MESSALHKTHMDGWTDTNPGVCPQQALLDNYSVCTTPNFNSKANESYCLYIGVIAMDLQSVAVDL